MVIWLNKKIRIFLLGILNSRIYHRHLLSDVCSLAFFFRNSNSVCWFEHSNAITRLNGLNSIIGNPPKLFFCFDLFFSITNVEWCACERMMIVFATKLSIFQLYVCVCVHSMLKLILHLKNLLWIKKKRNDLTINMSDDDDDESDAMWNNQINFDGNFNTQQTLNVFKCEKNCTFVDIFLVVVVKIYNKNIHPM